MEKITFEQLPATIALLLEKVERIESMLSQQPQAHTDDLLNIEQAAQFLDLAVATVYSKVCRKELPVNKKGKRIYFYRSELTDWIKKGRRQTLDELCGSITFKKKSNDRYGNRVYHGRK
jgi:excisionase family DNA binding protein